MSTDAPASTAEPSDAVDPAGPDALDVCRLILDSGMLDAASGTLADPAAMTVVEREILLYDLRPTPAPAEICSVQHADTLQALTVRVIADVTREAFEATFAPVEGTLGEGEPVEDLGDAAYVGGFSLLTTVAILVDDVAVEMLLMSEGTARDQARSGMVQAAMALIAYLPPSVRLAGLQSVAPCTDIDPAAVTAFLGGDPRYSRGVAADGTLYCSFATDTADVQLRMRTGGSDTLAEDAAYGNAEPPEPISIGDHLGYWSPYDQALMVAVGAHRLSITHTVLDELSQTPSPEHLALAEAAAAVLDPSRWPAPAYEDSGAQPAPPVDVCLLLSADEVTGLIAGAFHDDVAVRPVRHSFLVLGGGDATRAWETCGYGSDDRDGRLAVSVLTDVAQPDFIEQWGASGELQSASGIGDVAYVGDLGDTAVAATLVQRTAVLVWLYYQEPDAALDIATSTARTIAARIPVYATLPGLTATGPCAALDVDALTQALGGKVLYSRSFEVDGTVSCSAATQHSSVTITHRPGAAEQFDERAADGRELDGLGDQAAYLPGSGTVLVARGDDLVSVGFQDDGEPTLPSPVQRVVILDALGLFGS